MGTKAKINNSGYSLVYGGIEMEAKETVMTEDDIKGRRPPNDSYSYYIDFGLAIANVQAEISFKAGIKKVVEWVRKANHSGDFYYSFDQTELEAKLKEWGIDETTNR